MRLKTIKLAAMLLATTAIVGGGVEIWANLAARAELHAFLAVHPGVSVAHIYAEPLSGRLMLRGIAFGNDTTRVTIGHLDLPLHDDDRTSGFGLVSPAAASPFDDEEKPAATPAPEPKAAPAPAPAPAPTPAPSPAPQAKVDAGSADEITVTSGTTTAHIKHLEMTGTSLTKADIAAIFDPKSTVPAEARFKKLTASAIVMPEITVDDTNGGKAVHVTMSQVVLSGAKEGKIAAESIGRTTFTVTTGNETSDGEIGAVQASNLDLVQFARVFNSIRSDDAEPIRPMYDSVTITGIKVTDRAKHSTFSLTTLRETGLKGRPLATNFIAGAKDRTDKPSDAETKAAMDDLLHSIEIGSMEANDLSVRSEDKDGPVNFNVASIAMHDFAKQKIGSFALRALRFEGAEAKFGIASIDTGAFALPSAKNLSTSPEDSGAMLPAKAKLDINQIDCDIVSKDKDTDPKSDAFKRVQFKLNHIGLVSDGEPGDLPKASKLTIDNLVFDVPPEAGQASALLDMGYKRLDTSAALSLAYNPGAQELTIDNLSVHGVNMGTVGVGLHLVNVNKGIISPDKEIAKASLLAILVKGLKLDVINEGLFDRILVWKAKQDGMTPDQERAMAVDFFANKLPATVNNNANAKKVGEAIAKFFTTPKGLHISIVSKNGLGAASMGMLADPNLLLDTLDVKATND